jgi:hypothetical protein
VSLSLCRTFSVVVCLVLAGEEGYLSGLWGVGRFGMGWMCGAFRWSCVVGFPVLSRVAIGCGFLKTRYTSLYYYAVELAIVVGKRAQAEVRSIALSE